MRLRAPIVGLGLAIFASHLAIGDLPPQNAWAVLSLAIDAGGSQAEDALALLGTIDDERAHQLLDTILAGKDGSAITYAAEGLTLSQCARYLPRLTAAAIDPVVQPKPGILAAIARVGNADAVQTLGDISDGSDPATAGVAFGLLELIGRPAELLLEKKVTTGQSPWVRETAASILRRMHTRSALPSFSAALHDSDENVRIAGALGLAQWGITDGRDELEIAIRKENVDYRIEALIALATLGQPDALEKIAAFANGSDEVAKARAVWAIARSGDPRLKALAYQLKLEKNLIFRTMLVEKLLDPNDSRDLFTLQTSLRDANQMSGLIAAQKLLGTVAGTEADAAIVRGLSSSNDQVRQFAIRLASDHATLWPELARRANDTDPAMQVAALTAVMNLGQRDRFGEVEQHLTSGTQAVSLSAAKALASLDPKAARSVFEANITSSITYVRTYSAAMLLALQRENGGAQSPH